jgi:uncharacterized membrane protein
MKNIGYLLMLLCMLLSIGCSKSDNSEGTPMDDPDGGDPNPTALSYQNDIRSIIQGNCVVCHADPPTNNAPMSLTTLSQVQSAVETRGLLSRINSTTNPMPPDGLMPMSARQLIADWVDQGFPE